MKVAVAFEYDDQGRRILKGENGKLHYYFYENELLVHEIIQELNHKENEHEIYYLYDENGSIFAIIYDEKKYYYVKDGLNNIIGLLDEYGNAVAYYEYNAYGEISVLDKDLNIDTSKDSIGHLNPFRYKEYYYDIETKLYWLRTRYYNPKWGRFISPDSIEYLDFQNINGLNLYAYCNNNPIMYADVSGHSPIMLLLGGLLFGALAAGTFNAGMQLLQNNWNFSSLDLGSIVNSAIVGGTLGLSLALGIAYLGPVIAGGAGASGKAALIAFGASSTISFGAGAFGYAAEEWMNGRTPDFGTAMMHGGFVMLEGMISFGVGGIIGSVGTIGTKGNYFARSGWTKIFGDTEWWLKFIFGLEFTLPSKILINLLRDNI